MSDFELPTDIRAPGVNPLQDFEEEDISLPPIESDFEIQAQQVIDRAPQPEAAKKVLEQAAAIHNVAGLPWNDSFNKANTLATTQEPRAKKLGQAISDRWKAEQLTVRIGQTGNAARKAYQRGDVEEIKRLTKDYDALGAQLPALEDVAPAYPDDAIGAVMGFGRRALTGAAGIIGQQLEIAAGEQEQKRLQEVTKEPSRYGPLLGALYFQDPKSIEELKAFIHIGMQPILGIGEVEAGSAFMDLVKAGVDPGIADRFAKGIGAINNAIEFAQVATFVKMFPGAEAVISKATSGLLKKLLLGPVVKNTALRLTAKLATGAAEQLAQEIAQEAVTFYGENWAIAVQNATRGTALEGNKDFADRVKQLVYDFLPGVLALGAIPIGFDVMRSAKGETAKAAAKPAPAPTPMETVRAEVAKAVEAETPAAARATLDIAETAKATEIEQAEVLTPQLVNEAVELAGMQEAVEEQAQVTTEEVAPAEIIEPQQVKPAVESGQWVEDSVLGQFASEPWAKDELTSRSDLRELASYLADTDQATSFDAFVAAAKEIEVTPRSEEYYRGIWDTTAKAEVVLDEVQEVSTEARIDATIAAEEKSEKAESGIEAEIGDLAQIREQNIRDFLETADKALKEEQVSEEVGFQIDPRIQRLNAEIEDLNQSIADLKSKNKESLAAERQKRRDALVTQRETLTTEYQQRITAGREKRRLDAAAKKIETTFIGQQKRFVAKMIRSFLKPPSAGIGSVAITKIRALQEPYTVKETRSLNKAKKALTGWQDKHPGQALIPEAQAILNRKGIKDISVGELIDLYQESREIRKQGAIEEKARRERIKARRVQMATDILSDITGGVTAKRLAEFASEKTQRKERRLRRKGWLKSNIEHPLRLFKEMGPAAEEHFWNRRKKWEGEGAVGAKVVSEAVAALLKKGDLTTWEMLRKLPGTDYYIDDLMTYYGQMQDPNGRKAVLWGNDENETKITRLIGELPQKYKDFVDGVIDVNSKTYPEVERTQIENTGTTAPAVKRYLPIRREGDYGKPFAQELSMQAAVRESARMSGLQKDFTNQRVSFKEGTQQSRFRTDFLNILTEQIDKESAYVAGESWARDMDWLLGGKTKESKQVLEALKQKHGQPRVTFLKDYVNAVVNPESFNGKDFQGIISRGFRNMSDAMLIWKLSTAFIQTEGPFRTLAELDIKQWHYLFAGLWKASIHPKETAAIVYTKSPIMQVIAEGKPIDPAIQETRGLKHSRSEIALQLRRTHKGMREGGYFMLTKMQKWTVNSEWTSIYMANRVKLGEKAAIKAADDAVFMHQPSGVLADAPRMYWTSKKNIILAFLARFSRSSNQMAQMMSVDLWKDLKTGHPGKALGVVLSFGIGAMLMGLRRRKRFPKNAEELLEDGIAGATDALGAVSFDIASAVVAGATGGYKVGEIKPLETFYRAGAVGKDVLYGNVSQREVWRLINLVMQTTGLPSPAAENLVRTAYDFEEMGFRFDPIELFGRRPKE